MDRIHHYILQAIIATSDDREGLIVATQSWQDLEDYVRRISDEYGILMDEALFCVMSAVQLSAVKQFEMTGSSTRRSRQLSDPRLPQHPSRGHIPLGGGIGCGIPLNGRPGPIPMGRLHLPNTPTGPHFPGSRFPQPQNPDPVIVAFELQPDDPAEPRFPQSRYQVPSGPGSRNQDVRSSGPRGPGPRFQERRFSVPRRPGHKVSGITPEDYPPSGPFSSY
ncbi:uncharacterized protein PAC_17581 [Phialocephala subalpina]|uniref:Uncharacterized protein n=1 Tax=Phialocephala subalpina TaxID=576137 RepID=A0A1L7XRK4_9HELO|nr:uncharacterized protein PAC_17581 [Phialocephala subalpina]